MKTLPSWDAATIELRKVRTRVVMHPVRPRESASAQRCWHCAGRRRKLWTMCRACSGTGIAVEWR